MIRLLPIGLVFLAAACANPPGLVDVDAGGGIRLIDEHIHGEVSDGVLADPVSEGRKMRTAASRHAGAIETDEDLLGRPVERRPACCAPRT